MTQNRTVHLYTGPLQAVVLDWAGTTVDYGCFAPTMVFVDGFAAHGIDVTVEEARGPMGTYKRDHIATLMALPRITEQWLKVHGREPTDDDVETIFQEFIPRQLETIANHNTLIPGVPEAIDALRTAGLKVGSSTGYTEEMMARVTPTAAEQGYAPDCLVTSDRVPRGRPAPWLIYRNLEALDVYPTSGVVKIGDTVADITAGLVAGTWTIGLTLTGNMVGLSLRTRSRHYRQTTARAKSRQPAPHSAMWAHITSWKHSRMCRRSSTRSTSGLQQVSNRRLHWPILRGAMCRSLGRVLLRRFDDFW